MTEANKEAPKPGGKNVAYDVAQAILLSAYVYDFTVILMEARKDPSFVLEPPPGLTEDDMKSFVSKSIDLTKNKKFNGGNGLSLDQLHSFIAQNVGKIEKLKGSLKFLLDFAKTRNVDGGDDYNKNVFLMYHRSVQRSHSLVYSIIKNRNLKRIYIVFRGSEGLSNGDWPANFDYRLARHPTPPNVKDKMEGILQEQVMVHRGFYNYLHENPKMEGDQQGFKIYEDIKEALGKEEGYTLHVTGHSLGGALATMYSFLLAGIAGIPEYGEFIPKPVTCISIAAPYSGTHGYKLATEHLEREGFLRSLRVNVPEDPVPKALPWSLSFPPQGMYHTGINVRMTRSGCDIEHSSRVGFLAWKDSLLEPRLILNVFGLKQHLFPYYVARLSLKATQDKLQNVTIDELYQDENVVSKEFIDRTF